MDREYFLEIVQGTVAYVRLKTEKGEVKEFVVKLLCEFEGKYYEVLRYETVDTNARIRIYLIQKAR